jgi:maleate cis-trans isomerase
LTGSPLKICLVMPSGGPERDYYGFEEASGGAVRFLMAISRVGGESGKDHDLSSLRETGRIDWILEAAERILPFAPDVVVWACTSGSFIKGRAFAEQQIAAIEDRMGRPAGSTSLAFVAAAAAAGLRKVSVLATYPEPASRLFAAFLRAFDIEVLTLEWLAAPSGWDAAKFEAGFIRDAARRSLHDEAEALLIPDTALPSLHFVAELEADLGCPVLTANAVTLWDAQRLTGRYLPVAGFGRLLAEPSMQQREG